MLFRSAVFSRALRRTLVRPCCCPTGIGFAGSHVDDYRSRLESTRRARRTDPPTWRRQRSDSVFARWTYGREESGYRIDCRRSKESSPRVAGSSSARAATGLGAPPQRLPFHLPTRESTCVVCVASLHQNRRGAGEKVCVIGQCRWHTGELLCGALFLYEVADQGF